MFSVTEKKEKFSFFPLISSLAGLCTLNITISRTDFVNEEMLQACCMLTCCLLFRNSN